MSSNYFRIVVNRYVRYLFRLINKMNRAAVVRSLLRPSSSGAGLVSTIQKRGWAANRDGYRRPQGPQQFGQSAPYHFGYWHHGILRSILERSGWILFFFIPIEMAYLFYDFGFRRVDHEMGPYISDNGRYDGTEYDEVEKEVRQRWATDGTLAQYKSEHEELTSRYAVVVRSKYFLCYLLIY